MNKNKIDSNDYIRSNFIEVKLLSARFYIKY